MKSNLKVDKFVDDGKEKWVDDIKNSSRLPSEIRNATGTPGSGHSHPSKKGRGPSAGFGSGLQTSDNISLASGR